MYDPYNQQAQGLPQAPPGAFGAPPELAPRPTATGGPQAPQLPQPPPKAASLFDKDHRRSTLLAIGSGMLSGSSFGDGLGNASKNLFGLNQSLIAERKKQTSYGGPDNSFEITIDPATGQRTPRAVPEFQDYLEQKRTKARDTADINGRAMSSLQRLPEAERSGAYAKMIANPDFYGIDPTRMPPTYDPTYANSTANMGMTVAQSLAGTQRSTNAENLQDYRAGVSADRLERTGIYRNRAEATTAQGNARIGQGNARIAQGAERIGITRANAGRTGAKAKGKRSASNNDLSYIQ